MIKEREMRERERENEEKLEWLVSYIKGNGMHAKGKSEVGRENMKGN